MSNHLYDLTNAQVRLAVNFIERAGLEPNYRMLKMSDRYRRMIAYVRTAIDDDLIAADYGMQDLIAVRRYFVSKRDAFIANGQ